MLQETHFCTLVDMHIHINIPHRPSCRGQAEPTLAPAAGSRRCQDVGVTGGGEDLGLRRMVWRKPGDDGGAY